MESPYKINLLLCLCFLVSFGIVILTGINEQLFIDINSLAKQVNPFVWVNLTFLGDALPACVIMILFIRKKPDLVWSGIIATLIATLVVNSLKIYFNYPRPPSILDVNQINIIGPALYSHSFPSGHTVTIFTLTGILIFYLRTFYLKFLMLISAILIGVSRIAVGVHWPSDVLAGAAIGLVCGVAGVFIVRKLRWNKNKTIQLIIGFILIMSILYLLLFYDCRYKQAIYLQLLFSFTILIAGIREYYLLINSEEDNQTLDSH
jgi:membrane-associated phospholipid phosphatase